MILKFKFSQSPVSRPVSPRFAEIPQTSVPPLPFYKPPKSPILRSTSSCRTDEVTLSPIASFPPVLSLDLSRHPSRSATFRIPEALAPLSPVPHRNPSSHLIRGELIVSSYFASKSVIYQPPDLTNRITFVNKNYSASGGYGTVWKGNLQNGAEKCMVRSSNTHDPSIINIPGAL